MVKNLPANAGDIRDVGLISGLEDLQKEGMTTTPVFLHGESHGQRSLVDYSPVQFNSVQSLSHVQLFVTP